MLNGPKSTNERDWHSHTATSLTDSESSPPSCNLDHNSRMLTRISFSVSLRLGKAFWSRGPNICFQGFSSSAQTGPAAAPGNFPYLREVKPGEGDYPQDDFASLIQAYIELTQMMSSAHDTLYPNAARTRSLVVYGEYFKYLDELARSLDGFKILWRQKKSVDSYKFHIGLSLICLGGLCFL